MIVSIIVAVAENLTIGKDNQLIWHLPADLKFFKATTMGHHIIMGRKTFESIGKALPGRTSVLVTRNTFYKETDGVIVVNSLQEAIQKAQENNESEAFVIGGAELINDALPYADKIYLTEVKASLDGDVFLRPLDHSQWEEIKREDFKADDKHLYDYSFVQLIRKK